MGVDMTVLIADWSWLERVPPRDRLPRLREAWYADETGLWDYDVPSVEGDWSWPRGDNASFFALYEFRRTLGSYKPHFWAGERWEAVRDHAKPVIRTDLDTLLLGLFWQGSCTGVEPPDPTADFFGDDPGTAYGKLVSQPPDGVRELASTWERLAPRLDALRPDFTRHAASPDGWIPDFDAFAGLLEDWGRVLTEAAQRGWGVVGLKE
ncbi:hypothetical protein ACFYZ9_10225 [Streptomyces sp. NPDC001691]|uniref:hypothetical protein n=1 Tax=unclassified Streptomyces TaxID=2593676 RepID=UPI000DE8FF30|nr:hypothetical protein [Streptomyces sp. SDr-06]RCH70141.1 hypothetical protein DT019_01160 [Streptomyces sp. SDr-06]